MLDDRVGLCPVPYLFSFSVQGSFFLQSAARPSKSRRPVSACGLFTVTGDPMMSHIAEGDIVLVDRSGAGPGEIAYGKSCGCSERDTVQVKGLIRWGPKITPGRTVRWPWRRDQKSVLTSR